MGIFGIEYEPHLIIKGIKGNVGKPMGGKAGYMGGTGIYGGPSWRYKCGMPSRAGVPQGLLTLLFIPKPPKPSLAGLSLGRQCIAVRVHWLVIYRGRLHGPSGVSAIYQSDHTVDSSTGISHIHKRIS